MPAGRAFVRALLPVLCAILLFSSQAGAMLEVGGREPLQDPGWPSGALHLANLPTRASYWVGPGFGTGQYCLQYRSEDTKDFIEALEAFSWIVAPRLEMVVMDGAKEGGPGEAADWEFMVWVPADYYRFSRRSGPPLRSEPYCALPVPTLTVYLGKDSRIRWGEVSVPANVHVTDKRVEASTYKDSTGGVVEVHVYDMGTGKAMAGVTVSLSEPRPEAAGSSYRAETGEQGTAVIRNISKGTHSVVLSRAGYASRSLGYYRNLGRTLEVYNATLATAGALNGKVTDPDGKPVAGATVSLSDIVAEDGTPYGIAGERPVTDANGLFSAVSLQTGHVGTLRVRKEGYAAAGMSPEAPADTVAVTLQFAATLRGRIRSVRATSAGQEVHVQLVPEGGERVGAYSGSMTCGADGAFEFKDVPAGRYVLTGGVSPGRAEENERGPRKLVDVKPTKPGEAIEVEM